MKRKIIQVLVTIGLLSSPLMAQIIDTSGMAGSITGVGQSYNESRSIEVKVLTSYDIHLTEMILYHFNIGNQDTIGTVNARIFSSSTHALLYSRDTTLHTGAQQIVNMPVSFTLMPDSIYRIGFYCGSPTNNGNSANMWFPNSFPYFESQGILEILGAYDIAQDVFPAYVNEFAPVMRLNYDTANNTTGIKSIDLIAPTSVFPNPFTNKLNIITENNNPSEINIYDITSRKIITQNFINSTSINTDYLAKGIYIYELRNNEGLIKRGKMVKE